MDDRSPKNNPTRPKVALRLIKSDSQPIPNPTRGHELTDRTKLVLCPERKPKICGNLMLGLSQLADGIESDVERILNW